MRPRFAGVVAACVLLLAGTASAHRIDEYLQATILTVETHQVQASMRLVPGVLVAPSVIAVIDGNGDGIFSQTEQRAYAQRVLDELTITVDGKSAAAKLVSWSFPDQARTREGLGEIRVEYVVDLPDAGPSRTLVLANHHLSARSVYLVNAVVPDDRSIRIRGQRRNREQSVYELDFEQARVAGGGWRASWTGLHARLEGLAFGGLFRLGMRHIAEGTDHLLFLLALLLPAPLMVSGGHWGPPAAVRQGLLRILGIVTAFTVGHSLTLSLAAFGFVHLPGRPVEVLIAVSILISSVHALRPVFTGKEAWVAVFFGLVHGLAFAATLNRLGLEFWERMSGILAFNLGIEAMQMLAVAALLPSLMLMSRTGAYSVLRVGGAVFAGTASLGWVVERVSGVKTPTDAIINASAQSALWIAGGLFLVSLASWLCTANTRRWHSMPVTGR